MQRDAELTLGLSPMAQRDQTQAARVAALRAHDRALVRQRGRAVEVDEGRFAVAATARDCGERVEGRGLALRVRLLVQEDCGAIEERLREVYLVSEARDLGAVRERARVCFEHRLRKRVGERGERA